MAMGAKGGKEYCKPDTCVVEKKRGMIAGDIRNACHRFTGKVGSYSHQEEICHNGAGHYNGDGKNALRQQVGVDLVRETENKGKPDEEHDERYSVTDTVNRVSCKIAA